MQGKYGNGIEVVKRMRTTLNRILNLALTFNDLKKEDCTLNILWQSLQTALVYHVSSLSTFSPRLCSLHRYRRGLEERRGYSPGGAGRVWYDIHMLKLAVGSTRLSGWGLLTLTSGQSWGQVQQQRTLSSFFVYVDLSFTLSANWISGWLLYILHWQS